MVQNSSDPIKIFVFEEVEDQQLLLSEWNRLLVDQLIERRSTLCEKITHVIDVYMN